MPVQRGFFDLDERYAALSAAGDPLEKLGTLIDFEIFRPTLDAALQRSDGSKGGRPPLDAVMMFKTLILQTLYGLSDAQAEFQILDRRSFGRFLGLDDGDNTPDETTNTPRSNGWTGSTTVASSRPSAIYRLPKPRNATTPCWTPPWPHNLSRMASGNPGAVHYRLVSSGS